MLYQWPDDTPMISLNRSDSINLKSQFTPTLILGSPGAAKTTTTGAYLHSAYLELQLGGLVPCPKSTDYRDYMKLITDKGRANDVILMRPAKDWTESPTASINILDLMLRLFGRGQAVGN